MLAAEMPGVPWQSGVALAFDIGADTVMTEWEASLIPDPDDDTSGGKVKLKSLSPEEAWALL